MPELRRQGLSGAMVVRDFLRRSLAPLQACVRPVWLYTGTGDDCHLAANAMSRLLKKVVEGRRAALPQGVRARCRTCRLPSRRPARTGGASCCAAGWRVGGTII